MINLLPPKQKKGLKQEESYKLVLIGGIIVLFFLISLSLILFSIKIYIAGQAASQEILTDLEKKEFRTSEAQDFEREINLINRNLSKLNSFYQDQPQWANLLEKISHTLPEKTYLTTLSLGPLPKEKDKFQISLGGYCQTREILLDFKKGLEAESNFQEVFFPPTNWVKSKDIDFSATFKVEL